MSLVSFQQKDGALSLAGKAVGIVAVLLVTAVMYLAVNPAAHEFFHKGANHADHECVVTSFTTGEAVFVAPQVVVRPEAAVIARVEMAAMEIAHETRRNLLPPVCGPPAGALIT